MPQTPIAPAFDLGLPWAPLSECATPRASGKLSPSEQLLANDDLKIGIQAQDVQKVRQALKEGASLKQHVYNQSLEAFALENFHPGVMTALSDFGHVWSNIPHIFNKALNKKNDVAIRWIFDLPQDILNLNLPHFYGSALSSHQPFGLDVFLRLTELFPDQVRAVEEKIRAAAGFDKPVLERIDTSERRLHAHNMAIAIRTALSFDHKDWLKYLANSHQDLQSLAWGGYLSSSNLSTMSYTQCSNLSQHFATHPQTQPIFAQALIKPKAFVNVHQMLEFPVNHFDPDQTVELLKMAADQHKKDMLSCQPLGWTEKDVKLMQRYKPVTFFQALVHQAAPAVLTSLRTPQGRAAFDQVINESFAAAHAFAIKISQPQLIDMLTHHPDVAIWRDPQGNSLGHYYFKEPGAHTKSGVLQVLKRAPSWFEDNNTAGRSLTSFLDWAHGDTEQLKVLLSEKIIKSNLANAGLNRKKAARPPKRM